MKTLLTIFLCLPFILFAQQKHPLTVDDLWAMKRVGSIDLSPDGKTIAFTVTAFNMDENKGNSDIYLINSDGTNLHPLKNSEKNETSPKFSADGKMIAYIIDDQIHTCKYDGTDDEQITDFYTGVDDFRWSHDGKKFLIISTVYPDCTSPDCNKKKDDDKNETKLNVRVLNHLMYRSWNRWLDDKRSHLFLFDAVLKEYYDLNYLMQNDVPPLDLGSENDFNFSPDDKEIAYTMNPNTTVATSTNNEVYVVNVADIKKDDKAPAKLISQSKGNDCQPVYSPDGKYIAFTSMTTPGHESDQAFLILYDRNTGKLKNITNSLDRSVSEIAWSPDSKKIYFTANNEVFNSIYQVDISTGKISVLLKDYSNTGLAVSADGNTIYFKQQRSTLPYEIFALNTKGGDAKQITYLNKDILANIEMIPMESFWCTGAAGKKVQSILIKPPFFDPSKKYPMIFLIHGGPQGHWEDDFHFRWNIEMFAAKGYVVVAPNPTGSTGYGQQFTNDVSRNWGGRPYEDLMKVYDYSIKNFNYIDAKNTFAAGASFGGYMINWIEGHTNRFNAMVSHDGVFNTESMWGTTEELWFPEWEFNGTPWQNRKLYDKWNPAKFIQNAKTPMLVVEGARDYRVPEDQAFQLFTSLQRLGVDSKFLYFPDEFHFVIKPQDARFWWNSVFDWFETHKK
ncbi:MAG: S9 family peptidase [Ignavibacteriaceae bacterium]|nr:S9 family peptidase [Ignavibacteriaceae bacterium]